MNKWENKNVLKHITYLHSDFLLKESREIKKTREECDETKSLGSRFWSLTSGHKKAARKQFFAIYTDNLYLGIFQPQL